MPTAEEIQSRIQRVTDQESFINILLRDTLRWPIPEAASSVEDISYEWPLEDFRASGLENTIAEGSIFQIQPLESDVEQPWGVFIIQFKHADAFLRERGMTGVLRSLLNDLVVKARQDSQRPAWKREHLLFICTHGYRNFRFAYFKAPRDGSRVPPLASFGWIPPEPARTVCEYNLKELEWPSPRELEDPSKWVAKWSRAFDVEKVTKHFFDDYSDVFSSVEDQLEAVLPDKDKRRLFTQRLFNRLMFLRFVEKKDWLCFNERTDYLQALFEAGGLDSKSLYTSRIVPLFFTALAVPGAQESEAVGSVKYLNGGLFTRAPEDSLVPDIPDGVFESIIGPFGLFYRWNFTIEEATPLHVDVAVDPEMLGKVFEKLVTTRKEKGSYYTPRGIVSFMCKETLKGYLGGFENLVDDHDDAGITVPVARELLQKLKRLKVIDPACGSGAYLVGMLHELHELNHILDTRAEEPNPRSDYNLKLSIIQNNLYGVDIEEFAANTACLRLWLSLAVEFEGDDPEPLPNLEFKIGIGDSLTAPDPQTVSLELAHAKVKRYAELKAQYADGHLSCEDKSTLSGQIDRLREEIRHWVRPGVSVGGFDWAVEFAEVFLPRPVESTITGGLNLGDQLAEATTPGGFDIAIANPPYGATVASNVRDLYFDRATEGPQSKDTYGLFMARAIQLLRDGGQFSFIVSDTWRTIKSHRPLRKRLLEQTTIKHVLDLPPWVFEATVNTCILTLSRTRATEDHKLVAGDLRAIEAGNWKVLSDNLSAVAGHGFDAQTLTYARYSYRQGLIASCENLPFFIGSPSLFSILSNTNGEISQCGQYHTRSVPYRDGTLRLAVFGDDYTRSAGRKVWKGKGVAEIVSGIKTGGNSKYVFKDSGASKSLSVVNEDLIATAAEIESLTEEEKVNGKDGREVFLIPFEMGQPSDAEGGLLSCYSGGTSEYWINWNREAVAEMNAEPHSDLANAEYRFRRLDGQLSFSTTGIYAPTFRLATSPVFVNKASRIFFREGVSLAGWLGFLNSMLARYMLKTFINHTVDVEIDDLKLLPTQLDYRVLEPLVNSILEHQREESSYQYHRFEQKAIDAQVFELFRLYQSDIREIQQWYCRRYPMLAESQGFLSETQEKYSAYLAHCDGVLEKSPSYWRSHPLLTVIARGEGQDLEFKETLEYDVRQGTANTGLRTEVLKTVCAFLNTEGGRLLIGISDTGGIKGLEQDFRLCGRNQNADGFEQKLRSLLQQRIEPAPLGHVDVTFHDMPEGTVCQLDVRRSNEISHLDGEDIYVRDGNRSLKLRGRTRTEWIRNRGG